MTNLYEMSKLTGGTISHGAFFLNSNCLQSLKKMLKNSTFEERIEQFGMSSDRADVIILASLMFSSSQIQPFKDSSFPNGRIEGWNFERNARRKFGKPCRGRV